MIKGIQINACPLEMAGLKLLFYRVDEKKCKQHLFIRTPNSGTVWWNSGTVMVERCGGTVGH